MRTGKVVTGIAAGSMILTTALGRVDAQPGMPHPGAGSAPPHMLAEMCATASEHNLAMGHGFGMAFAADQQGYPGPRHILELKDHLRLTAEQEAQAQALVTAMYAESRPKSARLLDAEAKLRRLFASGQAEDAAVRAAVAEVEHARTELRLVHLLTHLRARDLLTDDQRRLYHEARWSARRPVGPHGAGSPGHGAPTK
jgi:Spy/CpxP family protein refolding chaperone